MPAFRLTQISDTHLARRLTTLTDNFHRVSEYIDATRPDLVVNSGDLAFDGPTNRDDLEFAKTLHGALPVTCRYLPGNHDIGDNPTLIGPAPAQPATEDERQTFLSIFGEDRWRFEAAGWCFIGLNSLIMNTGLASETEQHEWLASELSSTNGKPIALFLHKPLYLNSPDDPELPATSIRYVPMPVRSRLVEMLRAWAPSAGFIIPDRMQEVIGAKEVGLVEYRFQPDGFEVRHVKAPGQVDIGLDSLLGAASKN
jgi:3',5'-cyclic AMP phosphodiesterase CpdA